MSAPRCLGHRCLLFYRQSGLPLSITNTAKFHRSLTKFAYARPPNYGQQQGQERQERQERLEVPPLSENNARLLEVFPNPKEILLHFANVLQHQKGVNTLNLRLDLRSTVHQGNTTWEASIAISWPSELIFYGKSSSKVEAQKIAAAKACLTLKNRRLLDHHHKPFLYTWEDAAELKQKRYAPAQLSVPPSVITAADQWNRTFYEWCQPLDDAEQTSNMPVVEELLEEMDSNGAAEYIDIVSGEPKVLPDMEDLVNMSDTLYANHVRLMNSQDSRVREMQDQRRELPVFGRREEILETIRNNPVTLISGDTGSGKSTQVPQFLFESLIAENHGSEAQIVITQPRRISAVSLAERVAAERNEELGQTVGYQVRLESRMPPEHGCIFFCTTGILLRRLQDNPTLKGVSHVIVDEVHERDVLIDVLLSLLKNIVTVNPDIRIVLMSASMNSDLLKKYFDNCPIVEVEGYLHPVREHFLPESCALAGMPVPILEEEDPRTQMDLVYNLIKQIDSTRPEGGILVFLPGWQEIKAMRTRIMNSFYKADRHCVLTLHSMIPLNEQHSVFDRMPPHRRKIVLATNIAETSITINDIVYVVDPGNMRGQTYSPERGILTLDTHWISKANAIQRRGRAGRVRSGECFRLYSKNRFAKMDSFATPEVLRMPLEKVILDGKLFCPATVKAADFLSQLPQAPVSSGIAKAIEELIELKVLNKDETLTPLGESITHFSTHPRLSIALVYATLLRCLSPVLTIASFLSTNRDPFVNRLDNKSYVKEVKELFSIGSRSDHIASSNLLNAWLQTSTQKNNNCEADILRFCSDFGVSHDHLKFVEGIRQVLAEHLYDAYLVDRIDDATNSLHDVNEHEKNFALVKAALTAGIGTDILRVSKGIIRKGRLLDETVATIPDSDTHVELSRESVVSDLTVPAGPWFIYHSKFKSGESRKTFVKDITEVPALTMALFGGNQLELEEQDDDDMLALLKFKSYPNVRFSADLKTARVLVELRRNIEDLVGMTLRSRANPLRDIDEIWGGLRDVLCKLLQK
ncbi:putative ATP-dependent RNA helicase DHX30 [Hypsibius exemplaris]|uniref:ATP-dependent RNA helicase DHX30 n=1 Tax=Hypsibius exemplaris TaxID=2072580 RepID=A0A1W0WL65_HYPEX|nr:putative ATP-dependent RNA helicase DHX30 [Hypsibius exemplaris]